MSGTASGLEWETGIGERDCRTETEGEPGWMPAGVTYPDAGGDVSDPESYEGTWQKESACVLHRIEVYLVVELKMEG